MIGFLVRLLCVVPLLAFYLVAGVFLTVYGGLGWLFTGRLVVTLTWPSIS